MIFIVFDGVNVTYNVLTVNADIPAVETLVYSTTPSVSSVDYVIGGSSVVSVDVVYDQSYSDVLKQLPVFLHH